MVAASETTTNRYVGCRISDNSSPYTRKEVVLILLAGLSLYFLNGEHASIICGLFTSVPTAYFSYKALMSTDTTQQGFHAILFYWTMYGMSSVTDAIFASAFGYFFVKFLLLGLIFYRSVTVNKHVLADIFAWDEKQVTENYIELKSQLQYLYSLPKVVEQQFEQYQPSTSELREEDLEETQEATGSSVYMPAHVPDDDDTHTAAGFTFESYVEQIRSIMSSQADLSDIINQCRFEFPSRDDFEERMVAGHRATNVRSEVLVPTDVQDSLCTVGLGFGDIIVDPTHVVKLVEGQEATVSVINISQENIMWALKSNALHCLMANPVCGVITSGSQMSIRITLKPGALPADNENKLAIDYVLVGSTNAYSSSFIDRKDKRRHLLRLTYE